MVCGTTGKLGLAWVGAWHQVVGELGRAWDGAWGGAWHGAWVGGGGGDVG